MIFNTFKEFDIAMCGDNCTGICGIGSIKGINIVSLKLKDKSFAISAHIIVPGYEDMGMLGYIISPYDPEYVFINSDFPKITGQCKNELVESLNMNWNRLMIEASNVCDYNCGDDNKNCIYRISRKIPATPPDYNLLP